jgi:hypothetical protein
MRPDVMVGIYSARTRVESKPERPAVPLRALVGEISPKPVATLAQAPRSRSTLPPGKPRLQILQRAANHQDGGCAWAERVACQPARKHDPLWRSGSHPPENWRSRLHDPVSISVEHPSDLIAGIAQALSEA